MRGIIMQSKSKLIFNISILLLIILFLLMYYWQQKIVDLEQVQKSIVSRFTGQNLKKSSEGADNEEKISYLNKDLKGIVDEPLVIIYNRIPKTGSTSFMGVAYELCIQNNFHVIHLNTTKNSHVLNPRDQLKFAQNVSIWSERRPVIFHGHLAYTEFLSLGVNLNPIYLNILRDPLDRLVSYYYFLRNGDDFRPEVKRRKKGNKETFDECVLREGTDCDPANLWMQIPFFCGHHAACWEAGNSWALLQAKFNLASKYFLVGVTENIEEFIGVLQTSLPRFFNGALKNFEEGGKSHLRKTYGKQTPTKETVKTIKKSKIWQMEQDFYLFAKRNFNAIKKRTFGSNSIQQPLPQQFRYEKIRPK